MILILVAHLNLVYLRVRMDDASGKLNCFVVRLWQKYPNYRYKKMTLKVSLHETNIKYVEVCTRILWKTAM